MDRALRVLKDRIGMAFAILTELGYFAKQNFEDCNSCAWSCVPEESRDRAVFYHEQDTETMEETGVVYLSWRGDGKEIVGILEQNGLSVDWDGSPDERMLVSFNMRWEPGQEQEGAE
jgi:hypothetical protein